VILLNGQIKEINWYARKRANKRKLVTNEYWGHLPFGNANDDQVITDASEKHNIAIFIYLNDQGTLCNSVPSPDTDVDGRKAGQGRAAHVSSRDHSNPPSCSVICDMMRWFVIWCGDLWHDAVICDMMRWFVTWCGAEVPELTEQQDSRFYRNVCTHQHNWIASNPCQFWLIMS